MNREMPHFNDDLQHWKKYLSLALFTALIVAGTAVLSLSIDTTIGDKRAAERHYCGQLAEQVVAGGLPLDRYMTTECSLTSLAEVEGLDL